MVDYTSYCPSDDNAHMHCWHYTGDEDEPGGDDCCFCQRSVTTPLSYTPRRYESCGRWKYRWVGAQ